MRLNSVTIADIQFEWLGVVSMLEQMRRLIVATFTDPPLRVIPGRGLSQVLYNLPLLLACDVLKKALLAARDESVFACNNNQLGCLMVSSKKAVLWIDWDELRNVVRRRDKIAHDGMIFHSVQCYRDIKNIEKQLVAWNLIDDTEK